MILLTIFLQSAQDLSVAKEFVGMAQNSNDQSALLYVVMLFAGGLKTLLIMYWKKNNALNEELKKTAQERERLIIQANDKLENLRKEHALEIKEWNRRQDRTEQLLASMEAKLNTRP